MLIFLLACGEPIDDPSAFTELGVPGPRYQLGWGVQDVPWDSLSVGERANVLRDHLVALRGVARDPDAKQAARELLDELAEIDLDEVDAPAELERLKAEVVRLDEIVR